MADRPYAEVAAAFDRLLAALAQAQQAAAREAVAHFEASEPAAVAHALRLSDEAGSLRGRATLLRREWRTLLTTLAAEAAEPAAEGERTSRRWNGRVEPGEPTPRGAFRQPVLATLLEFGGAAEVEQVLARVEERLADALQEVDYLAVPSRPRVPRWRNAVHSARLDLVREGLLVADSPRGVWALSAAGRRAALHAAAPGPVLPLEQEA